VSRRRGPRPVVAGLAALASLAALAYSLTALALSAAAQQAASLYTTLGGVAR
jgi:hypothetical protein